MQCWGVGCCGLGALVTFPFPFTKNQMYIYASLILPKNNVTNEQTGKERTKTTQTTDRRNTEE